jgi:hypothetical protein
MLNNDKCRIFAIIFAVLFCLYGTISAREIGKTDLEIEGNVLGYELYKIRPISNILFPIVIKITKVKQGTEKSEYIKVLLFNLYEEFAEENFGVDKISTFRLSRLSFCDTKIKHFFRPGLTIENEKIVRKSQTFTLVPGVEKKSLPLKKVIPCYIVSWKD